MPLPENLKKFQRINIVGTSGSGKSTFGKKLGEVTGYPYIEIDKLFWRPNWQYAYDEEFNASIENSIKGDHWVLDGNYTRTTPIKWRNVQMVIWLDYSFNRVMFQAIKRGVWRAITRKELWAGTENKESFGRMLGKESIIRWTINTYQSNIEKYEAIMKDPKYAHIVFVRLKNPGEAKAFIRRLKALDF